MGQGVLYDANKCIGCRACQVACKQWNQRKADKTTNTGDIENPSQLTSKTVTKVRFTETDYEGKFHFVFTKLQCMHCEHPACAQACPVAALQKRPEGAVTYDDNRCFGCRYCMVACPFGIPTFDWDTTLPWIRKCTFCFDRQTGGLQPACVTTCPSDALLYGDREKLLAEAKTRIKAAPDRYVNHIYGEKEVGGTSWLMLSPVPFEKLGLPKLQEEPVIVDAERAMGLVPPVLIGVAAVMTGIYWVSKRRDANNHKKTHKQEGAVKK